LKLNQSKNKNISNPDLNNKLNNPARNTNDIIEIKRLVDLGADLLSTNGEPWNHTPLHQACYHNRPAVVDTLLNLLNKKGLAEKNLNMPSNPCGRGNNGKPVDLASIHPGVRDIIIKFLYENPFN